MGVGETVGGSAEGLGQVVDAFEGSVGTSVVVPGEDLFRPVQDGVHNAVVLRYLTGLI